MTGENNPKRTNGPTTSQQNKKNKQQKQKQKQTHKIAQYSLN